MDGQSERAESPSEEIDAMIEDLDEVFTSARQNGDPRGRLQGLSIPHAPSASTP